MLGRALTFLILALTAGYLGFFGLAGQAASIAKILLIAFVLLMVVSSLSGAVRAPPRAHASGLRKDRGEIPNLGGNDFGKRSF
jgi:uncharacterized membrane protein YtjA (UPF0391 family)